VSDESRKERVFLRHLLPPTRTYLVDWISVQSKTAKFWQLGQLVDALQRARDVVAMEIQNREVLELN
jgi:hypothetical protein